ncbi:MAG: PAS domain-containing protein [Proteobacteria bacterium]|nr:PAS domain-containing protein [Pseudomonadota bacterium]
MSSLLAASDDCIKVLGLDGRLNFMSEGGQEVMEVSDFNEIAGCPWPDFWRDRENALAIEAIEAGRQGRSSRFQGFADTLKGTRKYWDVKISPILGPDGQPEAILAVSRDVSVLKQAEERQRILGRELSHRLKNVIALIQAVANQTFRADADPETAKAGFMARLVTMGAAQDLLTQANWTEANMADIVAATERQHSSEQFSFGGPPVKLSSASALTMALALHELATNAAKYGALSIADGKVDLTWSTDMSADPPRFALQWRESNGPDVAAPRRKGFGSRMIERVLSGHLGGTASADYRPDGLVFTFETSLDALRAG